MTQSGIYFLSLSSASIPGSRQIVDMRVNGVVKARTYINNYFPGVDTSGQSLLLQLNASDVIQIVSTVGNLSSDAGYQTSFQGFLYEPVHGEKVAWTLTFPYGVAMYLYGPTDVNYTVVMLNEGSAWNSSTGMVVVPTSGIYFIRLSGTAWPKEYRFNLVLSVNGVPLINVIEKIDIIRTGNNLRSRSLVHHFNEGDQLVVSVPNGYCLHSYQYDSIYSGFLIQPDTTNH